MQELRMTLDLFMYVWYNVRSNKVDWEAGVVRIPFAYPLSPKMGTEIRNIVFKEEWNGTKTET